MSHKLLLADDSVTIQRVIELTFADEDVEVITVSDGRQAIERIRSERPDIVLADVGMPERDGYEVAAFVKGEPDLASIPVLLLTGAFEPVDEERAHAAGCDGVLAKPFEPQMVITRVKELLASSARRAPAQAAPSSRPATAQPASVSAAPAEDEAAEIDTYAESYHMAQPSAPEPPTTRPPDGAPTDEGVRIKRRQPISIPPAEPAVGLDDYFDRLDAAFASLNKAGQADRSPTVPGIETLGVKAAPGEFASPKPQAPRAAVPAPDEDQPFDFTFRPAAAGRPAPVSEPSSAPGPRAMEVERSEHSGFAQPAVSDVLAEEPLHSPVMAQAFSALLAAERGDPAPPTASLVLGAAAVSDELVEQIVQRVLERLTDRVVRETVADIVSNVAERLVRAEIDRVKASLK